MTAPEVGGRAPRVLVLGAVLGQDAGGVRRHAVELLPRAARLLAERGGGLSVLAGRVPLPRELADTLPVLHADVPFGPPHRRYLAERRALTPLAAESFDLVHTGHLPAAHGSFPFTLTLHDLRDLEPDAPWLRRQLAPRVLARAIGRARLVITVSSTVRAELERRFSPRAVALVPNAADHLEVQPREDGARSTGALLHVGHLEPRKNLELLVRALALDPELPPVVLAGRAKGDEDARLAALARSLGVAERVRILGPVPDAELPLHLAAAACVVIPSRLEGFGLGALEAQRAGAPLAVADAGALPEIAGEGVPRFAPDDPAALVRAVRQALAEDEATLARRRDFAQRFRWDTSARALVQAWTRAASSAAADVV